MNEKGLAGKVVAGAVVAMVSGICSILGGEGAKAGLKAIANAANKPKEIALPDPVPTPDPVATDPVTEVPVTEPTPVVTVEPEVTTEVEA